MKCKMYQNNQPDTFEELNERIRQEIFHTNKVTPLGNLRDIMYIL